MNGNLPGKSSRETGSRTVSMILAIVKKCAPVTAMSPNGRMVFRQRSMTNPLLGFKKDSQLFHGQRGGVTQHGEGLLDAGTPRTGLDLLLRIHAGWVTSGPASNAMLETGVAKATSLESSTRSHPSKFLASLHIMQGYQRNHLQNSNRTLVPGFSCLPSVCRATHPLRNGVPWHKKFGFPKMRVPTRSV